MLLGFSHLLRQEQRTVYFSLSFFFFCSDGGKWGQSVWGLFFWVSKELTVNSTQELPWQVWVLAAGCTWGVSLKNKTSIKRLKNICDHAGSFNSRQDNVHFIAGQIWLIGEQKHFNKCHYLTERCMSGGNYPFKIDAACCNCSENSLNAVVFVPRQNRN